MLADFWPLVEAWVTRLVTTNLRRPNIGVKLTAIGFLIRRFGHGYSGSIGFCSISVAAGYKAIREVKGCAKEGSTLLQAAEIGLDVSKKSKKTFWISLPSLVQGDGGRFERNRRQIQTLRGRKHLEVDAHRLLVAERGGPLKSSLWDPTHTRPSQLEMARVFPSLLIFAFTPTYPSISVSTFKVDLEFRLNFFFQKTKISKYTPYILMGTILIIPHK